jgi:hypothetical protein
LLRLENKKVIFYFLSVPLPSHSTSKLIEQLIKLFKCSAFLVAIVIEFLMEKRFS